jgi:PAS domain S-box-containing protein
MKTVFVGGGRGCRAVLELVEQERLGTLSLDILGVVDRNPAAPGMAFARARGWPTYTRLEEALRLPGLELVIELTGIDAVRDVIFGLVPEHVRVMDHYMARVFWDLDEVAQNLREELSRKTLLEAEIREDRHRLQELLDSLPEVVMVVDGDGNVERVNRRFEEVNGLRAEDVLGRPCFHRFADWREQGHCEETTCPRRRVLETERPMTLVTRETCLRGGRQEGEAYFEVTANPLRGHDGRPSVVMTAREVTERVLLKQETEVAARRFDQILATVHGMITIKDLEGRYQLANPAAERFFGIPAGDFLGKTAGEIFPRDVAEIIARNDQVILESGARLSNEEVLVLEGEEYVLISERILLKDYHGDPVGIFCVSRNITVRRRLQQELVLSEKHAAVGKLAAGVAHEINSPLTGVLTYAEDLMESTPEDDPAREDLAVIVRETLRCRQILRDLLDYSRQTAPNRQQTSIEPIIRRALSLVENQASFHDVRIDLVMAEHALQVEVDPNQIQQVMLNLIINARDAIDGKGEITVRTRERPRSGRVEVEVIDRGCGIPEPNLSRIFEPFFSTKGEQGNGLGLAAVRRIIDQHRGEIAVESAVGEGSTFRISLPGVRMVKA